MKQLSIPTVFALSLLCLPLCWACASGDGERETYEPAPQGPAPAAPAPDNQTASNQGGAEATETNFVPIGCLLDADCPPGIACLPFDADAGGPGSCDVVEAETE